MYKKILIALFGGILMGLATAPLSAWYLAWIALVPLWILIVEKGNREPPQRGKGTGNKIEEKFNYARGLINSPKKCTILSLIFNQKNLFALAWGCGYHGLALFWITGIHPMTWMGVPWIASLGIALFCWLFITFWGAFLVIFWSWGMRFFDYSIFKIRNIKLTLLDAILRVLIGVALWCGLEFIWSQGSLWWTSLSYTQSPHNLLILQWGKISGFSIITAAIVAVNGLFAEFLISLNNDFKQNFQTNIFLFLLAIITLFGLHLIGWFWYNNPIINTNPIKVGIIQGNIPNEIKLYPQGWREAIEGYTIGYNKLADRGVDIILTPETALPFFWDNIVNNSSFYQAILAKKVPVWIGAFAQQNSSFTNSIFTVTGEGKIFSRFDKIKLVPLGEFIPFESILGHIIQRLSPLDAHLVGGKSHQIFNTPFGKAIVGICYESAFSEHFRSQAAAGGEFIITASNNAHYSPAMPAQHHAQDVMRAIETDRWAARATNTGYSAIVDPHGRTLWISGINTYELHAETIYRRQTQTLYVKWGDWLTKILLVLGIGSWFWLSRHHG